MSMGFLGSAAPRAADVTLIVEMGMGAALIAGAMLARRGRYRAHAWCQSTVMLLNLIPITIMMVPSIRRTFPAAGGAGLDDSYYWLAALHGALGVVAELFGLYVMMVAGSSILPRRLRFTRYKLWMRVALGLWWITLLTGMTLYARWYVVPLLDL